MMTTPKLFLLVLIFVYAIPSAAFCQDSNDFGAIVKFKHKVKKNGEVLKVDVLANDIGSDDPRPVALWLSNDPILEPGDRFLVEDVISDYERASGMLGMPVLAKLRVKRLEEMEGKFAIITIGTAREVFQSGDQSLTLVRKIGRPECVSDLFLREDEPNDEEGVAVRVGTLKQNYCVSLLGEIEEQNTGGTPADIDRYRFSVKEDLVLESMLTHEEGRDFDILFVGVEEDKVLEVCDGFETTERCSIEVADVGDPVEIDFIVMSTSGIGTYAITIRAHDDDRVLETNSRSEKLRLSE